MSACEEEEEEEEALCVSERAHGWKTHVEEATAADSHWKERRHPAAWAARRG